MILISRESAIEIAFCCKYIKQGRLNLGTRPKALLRVLASA